MLEIVLRTNHSIEKQNVLSILKKRQVHFVNHKLLLFSNEDFDDVEMNILKCQVIVLLVRK
jgi:hypothetical protein